MKKTLLSLTNDYVFKRVFGEHLPVLADFLQAVLDQPVTVDDIRVLNPSFAADKKGDKLSALDIKVTTKKYGVIDVEIQIEFYEDLWKRFQYYTARMYVEQMRRGDDYENLTRAISIIVVDFVCFKDDDEEKEKDEEAVRYHHRFRFFDKINKVEYPSSMEINILEIPKRQGSSSKISQWLEFFAARTEEQFMRLAQANPAMEQAWGVIQEMSADEREREAAEAAEKARRDMVSRIRYAESKARAEGVEEGIFSILSYMLDQGRSAEEISTATGISVEKVASAAAKMSKMQ